VRRYSFRIPPEDIDDLLDRIMPLLPLGIRLAPAPAGFAGLTILGSKRTLPTREELEECAGRELMDFKIEDGVPADWRARRAVSGRQIVIGGKLAVRSPVDPPPDNGYIDVVVERSGTGFGSGAHPTTRMCLEMLVRLEPHGGLTDIGIFQVGIANGKFQGVISAQTPTGARTDIANLSGSSEGVVSPKRRRPSPAT
jgi:ribosomal protein L11 methyltransferase